MKKGILISSMLLLLMVSVFIGCSDDDEKTIASAAAAQGYLIGYVNLDPEIDFYGEVYPMTNDGNFTIDSIFVGDSINSYYYEDYWNVYGDNNYDYFYGPEDDFNYSPGDTAEIKFYRGNAMTSFKIRLIDNDNEPNIILPVNNDDTVSLGTPITFLWNSYQDADWYGIEVYSYRDSAGTSISRDYYLAQTDTTLTIPAASNIYDGYYYLYVMAVNGPGPGDPLNLNGAGLIGEFHSYSNDDYRRIYVGTGDPTPVSDDNIEPGYEPGDASRAIMDNLFGRKLRNENR